MSIPEIALLCLALLGLLVWIVGGIWQIVAGFRESALWGLLILFFSPIANLIFACTHWAEARASFITMVVGFLIFAGSIFAFPDARESLLKEAQSKILKKSGESASKPGEVAGLDAQIDEKRKQVEQLQAAFAEFGRDLPAQYQALEKRRTSLKPADQAAIIKYNAEADAYKARNLRHHEMQQEIVSTQAELDKLMDTRSRARAAANKVEPPR